MTRINTNVSSLVAQNTLGRSNASLNEALTRLSTGLRINTGKDDPAGLIASENLRSDITSIRRAISNTDRANQVIATADSALGQVSGLLNDIRGLVTESANSGALSQAQLDANQLQVDSSLEALNRIAQTTTFQGRKLLDGSLDFITSAGSNFSNLTKLQIDQANLGAAGQVSVDVNVTTAATQATVTVDNLPDVTPTVTQSVDFDIVTTPGVGSSETGVAFTAITSDTVQGDGTFSTTATGSLVINGETIDLTATAAGTGGNLNITALALTAFGAGSGNEASTFGGGSLGVTVESAEGTADIDEIIAAINADSGTHGISAALASGSTGTTLFDETTNNDVTTGTINTLEGGGSITLNAVEDNLADGAEGVGAKNITVNFGQAQDNAVYTAGTDTLVVNLTAAEGTATLADIVTAIDNGADGAGTGGDNDFTATLATGTGTDVINSGFAPATVTLANGVAAGTTAVTIDIQALASAGTNGDIDIDFVEAALGSGSPEAVVIGDATNGYTLQLNSDHAGGVTIEEIETALETIAEVDSVTVTAGAGATFNVHDVTAIDELPTSTVSLSGGVDEVVTTETIDLTTAVGVTGNIDIDFEEANLSGAGTNIVDNGVVGGNQSYTLQIDNTVNVTIDSIRTALGSLTEIGTAAFDSGSPGTSSYTAANDAPPSDVNIVGAGATTAANGLDTALVFELKGASGSEVLSFGAGTSLDLLIDGVNAVSDATGVTAEANTDDTGIIFTSSNYGSESIVDIEIIEEASSGAFTTALDQGTRVNGTDVVASVNGITATGNGNQLSINTATLDLTTTVSDGFVGTAEFTITGGGALFQLGPDVVSNQQARLGINSVNTAALGGVNGLLYQLGSGGTADLQTDATTAAEIVEEAIDQVTSLRGRLGAFQRTTLETNKNALNDTLVNLTDAESSIRDADFAAESAALTRSQILVQSGTTVLGISNQNPQNVLALLR